MPSPLGDGCILFYKQPRYDLNQWSLESESSILPTELSGFTYTASKGRFITNARVISQYLPVTPFSVSFFLVYTFCLKLTKLNVMFKQERRWSDSNRQSGFCRPLQP